MRFVDIFQIDDDALKIARGGGDPSPVFDRLDVMGEVSTINLWLLGAG